MMQEDISYLTYIKYHFVYMYMLTWREFVSVIGGLRTQSTGDIGHSVTLGGQISFLTQNCHSKTI